LKGRRLFGGEFVLKLRHLKLQVRDVVRGGITIRISRLIGGWIIEQRVPLLPGLVKIEGRLAVECEAEQQQSG
jgi:hypothetical protein